MLIYMLARLNNKWIVY